MQAHTNSYRILDIAGSAASLSSLKTAEINHHYQIRPNKTESGERVGSGGGRDRDNK